MIVSSRKETVPAETAGERSEAPAEAVPESEEKNEEYLRMFEEDMEAAGLAKATRSRHLSNARLFLENYLPYYEPRMMATGTQYAEDFLGDWFIRKCGWASANTLRAAAGSLKKFYESMSRRGLVSERDYQEMCETIKSELPDWLDTCAWYRDR